MHTFEINALIQFLTSRASWVHYQEDSLYTQFLYFVFLTFI